MRIPKTSHKKHKNWTPGLCHRCNVEKPDTDFYSAHRKSNSWICKSCIAEANKKHVKKTRALCLAAYGGKCACCGESIQDFLTIDHVNGGGNAHRRLVSKGASGTGFYYWLKASGWPTGFQVLCYNCNNAKGRYGTCPHKYIDVEPEKEES